MSGRHQPKGFEILYEDKDVIVGSKAAGSLAVAALWNKEDTIHAALNMYVRKGNARSKKRVFVVHRLDQATSGVMLFAKTEQAQTFLKDNWTTTKRFITRSFTGGWRASQGLFPAISLKMKTT